ncbi:hypothetical protein M3Y99_01619000 [Aphelenchoides fujianensis]|nr:hypothetical protein M3Y99_01619000 [Aphelenchoides fujianensis]
MHRVLCTFFCDLWVLPKISELNDEKRAKVVTKIIGQMLEWSLDPMPLQLNKWYDALTTKAPEYVRLYREAHNDEEKGEWWNVQKKQWMDLMSGKISYKMEDILWDVLIQRNQRGYDFRNSRVHKLIEGDEYERKYAEKYCPVPSPSKLSKLWQKLRTIGRKNRASLTALLPASIPPGLIVQTFEEEFDIISVEGEEEKFEEFVEGLKFLKYKQFPPAELEMLVNTEVKIRLAALKYVDVSEEPTELPADLEPPDNRKPRSSFNF